MTMKNETKIRKYIGTNYHLHTEFPSGKWSLYKKCTSWRAYISEENKPIMTSETHTEKDLLKFAKKHRKYRTSTFAVICAILVWVFCILSIISRSFFKNEYIATFFMGIQIGMIITEVIHTIIDLHNANIEFEETREELERLEKELNVDREN